MRALKTSDLFAALRLVRELGVKDEVRKLALAMNDPANKDEDGNFRPEMQREIGSELIFGLLANCGAESAEKAFFSFLSGPMEIPVDDLKGMDLEEFGDKIMELIKSIDMEHWKAFFSSLADLMKRQN